LDGKHSLDAMRNEKKHKHHGLDLDRGSAGAIRHDCTVEQFFAVLRANVHRKKGDGAGQPWGHFCLFYRSLSEREYFVATNRAQYRGSPLMGGGDLNTLSGVRKREIAALGQNAWSPVTLTWMGATEV